MESNKPSDKQSDKPSDKLEKKPGEMPEQRQRTYSEKSDDFWEDANTFADLKIESHHSKEEEIYGDNEEALVEALKEQEKALDPVLDLYIGEFKSIASNIHSLKEVVSLNEKGLAEKGKNIMFHNSRFTEFATTEFFSSSSVDTQLGLDEMKRLPTALQSGKWLPIYHNSDVLVISGATGCGKSSMVAPIISSGSRKSKIVNAMPTRSSSSGNAARIKSFNSNMFYSGVNNAVDKNYDRRNRILTCTLAIASLLIDVPGAKYTAVILDEFHERNVTTSILMHSFKKRLAKNTKLIIMTATLDPKEINRLDEYFPGKVVSKYEVEIEKPQYTLIEVPLAAILILCGKYKICNSVDDDHSLFEIEEQDSSVDWESVNFKMMQDTVDWLKNDGAEVGKQIVERITPEISGKVSISLCLLVVHYLWNSTSDGKIVVFVAGKSELDEICDSLDDDEIPNYGMHSQLEFDKDKIDNSERCVIIATNITETSITIKDAKYVIDFGYRKKPRFSHHDASFELDLSRINMHNKIQRKGRTGRMCDGFFFPIYEDDMLEDPTQDLAEPLYGLIMRSAAKIDEIGGDLIKHLTEDLYYNADKTEVENCLVVMRRQGLINDTDHSLSSLGYCAAQVGADGQMGLLPMMSLIFRGLDFGLDMAAVVGTQYPIYSHISKNSLAKVKQEQAISDFYTDRLSYQIATHDLIDFINGHSLKEREKEMQKYEIRYRNVKEVERVRKNLISTMAKNVEYLDRRDNEQKEALNSSVRLVDGSSKNGVDRLFFGQALMILSFYPYFFQVVNGKIHSSRTYYIAGFMKPRSDDQILVYSSITAMQVFGTFVSSKIFVCFAGLFDDKNVIWDDKENTISFTGNADGYTLRIHVMNATQMKRIKNLRESIKNHIMNCASSKTYWDGSIARYALDDHLKLIDEAGLDPLSIFARE